MRFILGLFAPRKKILGTDFAGEIVETGSQVNKFRPGERVFGFFDTGLETQAEFTAVAEKHVFPLPDGITYEQAAAALEGAHYAYSFLKRAQLKAGNRVLINGATGAIGSALLQFVKPYEVFIAATCRTEDREAVISLGADKVYDYIRTDFTQGEETYDFVFDTVGKSTFGKCRRILKKKGVYTSSEMGPGAQNPVYALVTPFFRGRKVIFPVPYPPKESIPFIITQLKAGTFRPLIDKEYALDEVSTAYEYVCSGKKKGNVILKLQ